MTLNCGHKSIFSSSSYWVVPLARDQDGQALIEQRENILECVYVDGRGPSHSFNSPQSETDFRQLVSTNLEALLTKNTVTALLRQSNENNYHLLCLTLSMTFPQIPHCSRSNSYYIVKNACDHFLCFRHILVC